ncbi:hypothetical protein NQ315_004162 [Exocentrus adspersus]|uniref:Uncharacterized protein n=1 Tax=Exocentrus adspersus TaxID=1586481 RepID=A0AAV8W6G6_9CUCU|nr:hypothetical protein NQ315_004162 [Exocentrus adspersus]
MAQGKLKIKTKLPQNIKIKKQKAGTSAKRSNCLIKPKKKNHQESQKLKKIISKTVNKAIEEEIRAKATSSQTNLSKAQQAVAKFQSKANG